MWEQDPWNVSANVNIQLIQIWQMFYLKVILK